MYDTSRRYSEYSVAGVVSKEESDTVLNHMERRIGDLALSLSLHSQVLKVLLLWNDGGGYMSNYYNIRSIKLPNGDYCNTSMPIYAVCTTAPTSQCKIINVKNVPYPYIGMVVRIEFINAQLYNGTPELSIDPVMDVASDTPEEIEIIPIYRNSYTPAGLNEWDDGDVLDLCYNEESWVITNGNAIERKVASLSETKTYLGID